MIKEKWIVQSEVYIPNQTPRIYGMEETFLASIYSI